MMFRRHPSGQEGFDRWRIGQGIGGPVVATQEMLMWEGGSLGWHSDADRMRGEGRVPIGPVPGQKAVQDRLASSWNAFVGVLDASVSKDLLDRVWLAATHLGMLDRDDLGSGEARHLGGVAMRHAGSTLDRALALHVPDRVDGRGHNFPWGLVLVDGEGERRAQPRFLTAQTFRQADAQRLASCWNAAAGIDHDVLRTGVHARLADLVVNASLAIAAADLAGDPVARDRPRTLVPLLAVAASLVGERVKSGAYAVSAGSHDALRHMTAMADVHAAEAAVTPRPR